MGTSAPLHVTRRAPGHDRLPPRRPFLLVHGSMDRASSFGRVQGHLPDREVITYDRRGYAGSMARTPTTAYDDQVDDLLEVVAGQSVVALGHSYGGTVLLGAAARAPHLILGAVIWEPPMPWLAWWPTTTPGRVAAVDDRPPEDVAEAFMRRQVGDRIWNRLKPTTREQRRAEGPALVAEMRGLDHTPRWDPADISVPMIVGYGSDSAEHQRRSSEELAAALPHARLVELAGSTHGSHLSHPVELAQLLEDVDTQLGAEPVPDLGHPEEAG